MESSMPPSYADVALQDLPGLSDILSRREFLVYPRKIGGKHEVKSNNKNVLCVGKWKQTSPLFTTGPTVTNLSVKTVDKREVLSMTKTTEGFLHGKKKVFEMIALPNTPLGQIIRDEKHHYKVIDQSAREVLHVQKIVKMLSRTLYKVLTPDGKEIGTIGDNKGSKHVLQIPASLPLSQKALLLGFTLSVQAAYDDAEAAAASSAATSGAVSASC